MADTPTPASAPATAAPTPPSAPAAAPAHKHARRAPSEMRFGSYPIFAMFWPLVAGGEICAWLVNWKPEWAENVTWVFLTILLTCLVTAGFDVRRNLAIGWLLFIALCWVGGLYLRDQQHIPVLGEIRHFLAGLDATVSTGFLHAVALLVGIGLFGVFLNVFMNHRWRVTHNELHLVRRGDMEDAITRGAKRITVEYPDIFELLLLGSGHVVVRDSKGKEEIRRIPRVPLLIFRERQLDAISEVWGVSLQSDGASTGEDEET
jgi:hypothetical protein